MIRTLIEMAVACGRKRQSTQTPFVHYFPHLSEDESSIATPVYENFLFILALFRSRTAENIGEAKTLLERLLYFQNLHKEEHWGNFPFYLHDFPTCHHWYTGISLLNPIFWILSQFNSVLGASLKARLENSVNGIFKYCKTLQQNEIPTSFAIKLASATKAFGLLWKNDPMISEGEAWLSTLALDQNRVWWGSPASLGDALASLQMAYPSLAQSPWKSFWDFLETTWQRQCCSFSGPCLKEFQYKYEPEVTLYDLYLGYLSAHFSKRALQDHICHLQGVLIQPLEEKLQKSSAAPPFGEVVNTPEYALSLIEKKEGGNKSAESGFHPFRLVWGTPERTHSFVCQGGNSKSIAFSHNANEVESLFTFGELIQSDDREKLRELIFYLDLSDDHQISVGGIPTTTFQLEDPIVITSPPLEMTLRFFVEVGKGQFMGHIMKGNRPSQTALRGSNRHQAYDWQIFLRTIRRTEECALHVKVEIKNIKP